LWSSVYEPAPNTPPATVQLARVTFSVVTWKEPMLHLSGPEPPTLDQSKVSGSNEPALEGAAVGDGVAGTVGVGVVAGGVVDDCDGEGLTGSLALGAGVVVVGDGDGDGDGDDVAVTVGVGATVGRGGVGVGDGDRVADGLAEMVGDALGAGAVAMVTNVPVMLTVLFASCTTALIECLPVRRDEVRRGAALATVLWSAKSHGAASSVR
jgi:hypothetical protein